MKRFKIELDFNGMVLFDPQRLVAFKKDENINTTQLFQYFVDHEETGKKAIDQGIIIPIYPIDAHDYEIEATLDEQELSANQQIVFSTDRYGLESYSGIVVFSDIYAIMEWDDEDFFLNYIERYGTKSAHNDFFETGRGKFQVKLQGYKTSETAGGYRFLFHPSNTLPQLNDEEAVDDIDFNLIS